MKIIIQNIPREGLSLDLDVPVKKIVTKDLEHTLAGNVHFKGHVSLAGRGVLVAGDFKGAWKMECARCLEPFEMPVADDFRIFLTRKFNELTDKVVDLSKEDLDESELVGEEIDLGAVLREQMILQIPIKPVCSEQCMGLCPECGQNLNLGSCSCLKSSIDPRLVKLKQLFQK
jgi:uncharacterized protein